MQFFKRVFRRGRRGPNFKMTVGAVVGQDMPSYRFCASFCKDFCLPMHLFVKLIARSDYKGMSAAAAADSYVYPPCQNDLLHLPLLV